MNGFREHWVGCPLGRPPGMRRLDLRFDYLAFPVWGWGTVPGRGGAGTREVVGMVRPEGLGISDGLVADLWAWSTWADTHGEYGGGDPATTADRTAWWERGRDLARRLEAETGAAVVFGRPADPACPTCRPTPPG